MILILTDKEVEALGVSISVSRSLAREPAMSEYVNGSLRDMLRKLYARGPLGRIANKLAKANVPTNFDESSWSDVPKEHQEWSKSISDSIVLTPCQKADNLSFVRGCLLYAWRKGRDSKIVPQPPRFPTLLKLQNLVKQCETRGKCYEVAGNEEATEAYAWLARNLNDCLYIESLEKS